DEHAVDGHEHQHDDDGEHDGGDHRDPSDRSKLTRVTDVSSMVSTRRVTPAGSTGTWSPTRGRRPSRCQTRPPTVSTSMSGGRRPKRSNSVSTSTSPRAATR